ncbi:MAG: pimeloyl-ACP methyl ester esterase BioH [Gammaproteobacteria bacterium]|nr:MAG: pimeloyl-ACP methyl ester esterase BioH [Gammaproteobacteria bacterium]
MTIYVEQHGAGQDLLLLHGWGLHGGIWSPVLAELVKHYRVTVVDLPGHGRSHHESFGKDATLTDIAKTVKEVIQGPAVWLGWSMGGMVALAAARQWPDEVRGLILVATTPRFVVTEDWPSAVAADVLQQFGEQLASDYRRALLRFISLQLGAGPRQRLLLKLLRAELFRFPAPSAGALESGLELLRQSDLRRQIGAIAQPACVIHGERDRLVPVQAGRYLAQQLADATSLVIAEAGHAPFLSHPSDFMDAIQGFMSREGLA